MDYMDCAQKSLNSADNSNALQFYLAELKLHKAWTDHVLPSWPPALYNLCRI